MTNGIGKIEVVTNEWKSTGEVKIAEAVIPTPTPTPGEEVPSPGAPSKPPVVIPAKTRKEIIEDFLSEHRRVREILDFGCTTIEELKMVTRLTSGRLDSHLKAFASDGYIAELKNGKGGICTKITLRGALDRLP